ncbi:MAG: hypothetical protein SFH39_00265 [Candidatus Magnetobacterium sp. LHC-1]
MVGVIICWVIRITLIISIPLFVYGWIVELMKKIEKVFHAALVIGSEGDRKFANEFKCGFLDFEKVTKKNIGNAKIIILFPDTINELDRSLEISDTYKKKTFVITFISRDIANQYIGRFKYTAAWMDSKKVNKNDIYRYIRKNMTIWQKLIQWHLKTKLRHIREEVDQHGKTYAK